VVYGILLWNYKKNPFLIIKIQKNQFCASFQFYFLCVFLVSEEYEQLLIWTCIGGPPLLCLRHYGFTFCIIVFNKLNEWVKLKCQDSCINQMMSLINTKQLTIYMLILQGEGSIQSEVEFICRVFRKFDFTKCWVSNSEFWIACLS
jgi:hypothetical protein